MTAPVLILGLEAALGFAAAGFFAAVSAGSFFGAFAIFNLRSATQPSHKETHGCVDKTHEAAPD